MEDEKMKLISLGAGEEVGRSAFVLEEGHKNVLLDYGLKIHSNTMKNEEDTFPIPFANFNIKPNLTLISHSHLDHIGYLPSLFKKGDMQWYATPPTVDIGEVLWNDTMKLAKMQNKRIPFTNSLVEKAKMHWHPIVYNQEVYNQGIKFSFHDAGHILGSSSIRMDFGNKKVIYSGDYKGSETALHAPLKHPGESDIVITEGTYWEKDHQPRKEAEMMLMDHIHETLDNGGNVLIPAFAIGRTQEMITIIKKYDKNIPVYVDGMGKQITKIYDKYPNYLKDFESFASAVDQCKLVEGSRARKKASNQGNVIVSTAGMLEGGPALQYINQMPPNSKIILTGFQVEGSNGRYLLDDGKIKNEMGTGFLNVDIEVEYIDFSAHAGKSELIDFVKRTNAQKVVVVHSDHAKEFAQNLKDEEGMDAVSIKSGEMMEI
ncbi:MAG: MBL fold metallo-hydrolase [Candidatus Micrarchaeota archaeon]|nr:MBL fold metallo-hydrolase [Candidatus Micrarchaeota archaeon]